MKDDQDEFNFAEGKYRAEEGMSRAERTVLGRIWMAKATAWLDKQRTGLEFTSDDVVADCGLPGTPGNKSIGAWFSKMAKAKLIVVVRLLHKSERPSRHTGLQRVWRKV